MRGYARLGIAPAADRAIDVMHRLCAPDLVRVKRNHDGRAALGTAAVTRALNRCVLMAPIQAPYGVTYMPVREA